VCVFRVCVCVRLCVLFVCLCVCVCVCNTVAICFATKKDLSAAKTAYLNNNNVTDVIPAVALSKTKDSCLFMCFCNPQFQENKKDNP